GRHDVHRVRAPASGRRGRGAEPQRVRARPSQRAAGGRHRPPGVLGARPGGCQRALRRGRVGPGRAGRRGSGRGPGGPGRRPPDHPGRAHRRPCVDRAGDDDGRTDRMTTPRITDGFHHITLVASDARRTLAFWRDLLGLGLVKQTVNFDDPSSYHLYFGDELGRPGTLVTFFEWGQAPHGHYGIGGIHHLALGVGTPEA